MGNIVNSVPPLVKALHKAQSRRGDSAKATGLDRTDPQWYENLVRYYMDRRSSHDSFWSQVEKKYRQKHYERNADEDVLDRVVPGRVYGTVHKTESLVLNRSPKFHLRGFTASLSETAVPPLQRGLNNEWHEDRRLRREMKLCARDAAKFGWGIALTTYDAEFAPDEQREAAEERRELSASDPVTAMVVADVEAEIAKTAAADVPPEEAETFEQDSRVIAEQINTRRVSPWHFLVDPDATCLEDAQWMGRIIVTSLEAVKADDRLKNTDGLKATDVNSLPFTINGERGKYQSGARSLVPADLVTLYEIYERVPGKGWRYVLLAKDHDQFLRVDENLYWIGCPYSLLRWNEDGEEIFAQSDFLPIWTEIVAEELLMTKALDGYARDAEDRTFIKKDVGVEEELWAVEEPGSGVKVSLDLQPGERISDVMMMEPSKSKSWPDYMNFLAMLRTQIEMSSGQGPNQTGQALKSGSSAFEANEIAQNARASVSHKQDAMEDFVATVAYQRLGMMAQFYDAEQMARIAGNDAADAWAQITWTPGDVQRGLRVVLHQGSMAPVNDSSDFQRVMQTFGVVNGDPVLRANTNIPGLQKRLFESLWGADAEGMILETNPEEVAKAQAQMAVAQATGGGSAPAQRGQASQPGGNQ